MCRVALAPAPPFSVSAELLRQSAILARQYGVRLHTHLCETKDEENFMLAAVRASAPWNTWPGWAGWARMCGSPTASHFNDEELRLLAQTGTGVAHCPISNMKLSSGIARIPEMLALGVPVGLAVDGSAINDGSSLLEELRVAFLLHRLNASRQAPTGYDVLKMATRGSARLLGRDDIGQLSGQVRRPVPHRQPPFGAGGLRRRRLRAGHGGRSRPGGLHRGPWPRHRAAGPPRHRGRGKGRRRSQRQVPRLSGQGVASLRLLTSRCELLFKFDPLLFTNRLFVVG